MIRWIKIGVGTLLVAVLFALGVLGGALALPAQLFEFEARYGEFSFHANQPIPAQQAETVLKDISARLGRLPLGTSGVPHQLYVVSPGWKRALLWTATNRVAGGFIVAPITRHHAFLSGADFAQGLLVSPSGNLIMAPRTLAYYGAHELAHADTAQMLGTIAYHRLPAWMREGLADYVAFVPRQSFDALLGLIGEQDADLAMMTAFGVYAPDRLLVSYFLDVRSWSVAELLTSGLSKPAARARMHDYIFSQNRQGS